MTIDPTCLTSPRAIEMMRHRGGHNRSDYCSLRGRGKKTSGSLQPGATLWSVRTWNPIGTDSAPKELVGRLEKERCRAGIPSVLPVLQVHLVARSTVPSAGDEVFMGRDSGPWSDGRLGWAKP